MEQYLPQMASPVSCVSVGVCIAWRNRQHGKGEGPCYALSTGAYNTPASVFLFQPSLDAFLKHKAAV